MTMVNWENYEEQIMLYVDGELTGEQQQALFDFLELHPELKAELKMYQTTTSVPDPAQVFEGKELLLRPVSERKVISLRQWWTYGAAAGIKSCRLFH